MSKPSRSIRVPLVRFSHSLAFKGFLKTLGAPADRYLETGKLPTLCEEPNYLIPVSRMYAFLDKAARKEEPLLGWRTGENTGHKQLSTSLRNRLEAAPSLLMALQSLADCARNCLTEWLRA